MPDRKIPSWIQNLKDPKVIKKNGYIPVYSPEFSGNESRYVNDCLSSSWISSKGPYVGKYEAAFAKYVGSTHAAAASSGTAALFLALKLLNIGKNDEVIVPSFTMISSAFAVSYTGARPVFADCGIDDGNITAESVFKRITKKTRAVMPVHIYGNPCSLNELGELAGKYKLALIEDAAEALGSEYEGEKIGSHGNLACFSTYVNKIVTTGEGGMIALNDKDLYNRLKILNNYFYSPQRHFWHPRIGYNFKLSALQAAVGLAQLETAEETVRKKRDIFRTYEKLLLEVSEYFYPLKVNNKANSNYWHIAFRLNSEKYGLTGLRNHLSSNGIETRTFFLPLHLQPAYRGGQDKNDFPNSEKLSKTGLLLPSGSDLKLRQIEKISRFITGYFKK